MFPSVALGHPGNGQGCVCHDREPVGFTYEILSGFGWNRETGWSMSGSYLERTLFAGSRVPSMLICMTPNMFSGCH